MEYFFIYEVADKSFERSKTSKNKCLTPNKEEFCLFYWCYKKSSELIRTSDT